MAMTKRKVITIAVLVVGLIVLMAGCGYGVSVRNQDAKFRNLLTAKQEDNKSEFDNMWKKIKSVAQVTEAQKNALKEIFVDHAKARGGVGNTKIMTWLKESVPNVDLSTYNRLQNIIVSSRDAWTMRQKELLDIKREHDNLIDVVPSSIVLAMLGRDEKVDVTIVTSTRTTEVFKSGKDDDVDVFGKD
jgi:uncharacterized membrane protein YvbJ